MAQRLVNEEHVWLAAATIQIDDDDARRADARGYIYLRHDTKIVVLETYCEQCRRPRSSVTGTACEAADSNKHLIGGPPEDIRARRKHTDHDCKAMGCTPDIQRLRRAVGA